MAQELERSQPIAHPMARSTPYAISLRRGFAKLLKEVMSVMKVEEVHDLYRSFMATDHIESLGISPIAADLEIAASVHDAATFISAMAKLEARGTGGLFSATVYTDAMDSMSNIIYLSQGGLSLPDEAYYREDQYQPIRDAFLAHVARMFELAGISDGALHASEILKLETSIASHHWDQVRDRDATLTYNKATRTELEKLSAGFDWKAYLDAAEVPASVLETTIVREPSFFTGLGHLMANFHAHPWKSWLQWQVISSNAPYLHEVLVQENFAFYGTTLSGIPQLRERWKRGVGPRRRCDGRGHWSNLCRAPFPAGGKGANGGVG
jgi:putative endopeptidase